MTDETHGTLLRLARQWCDEHGAEFLGVGAGPSPYPEGGSLWRAEVRFPNGRSYTAHAPTQAQVIDDLTRLGLIVGGRV